MRCPLGSSVPMHRRMLAKWVDFVFLGTLQSRRMQNIIIHRSTDQDKKTKNNKNENQQSSRYKVFRTVCVKEREVLT